MTPLRRLLSPHALLLQGLILAMALTGLDRASLPILALLYTLAFAVLVHGVRSPAGRLGDPWALLFWAVAFRATLFPVLPDLSDDPFRYVWDGWLTSRGTNPYAHVPADPALSALHQSPLFQSLNSPHFFSVYPPLSQLLFLPAGLVYEHLGWPSAFYALKATIVGAELVGAALLLGALRKAGRPLAPFALYAWNPLVLVTIAGNAHSEGGMVLGVGLLLAGLTARTPALSWLGLTAAGMVKLFPLAWSFLLLRFSARRWGGPATGRSLAGCALAGLALLAPFWFPGMASRVGSSMELYVGHFEFNAGLYFLLKEGWMAWAGGDPGETVARLLGAGFLAWLAWVSLRHPVRSGEEVTSGLVLVTTGYLVTATTVHPWYLLWVLVLVPFTAVLRWPWVWASYASFGTYFTYLDWEAPHQVHLLLTATVWGGFAALATRQAAPEVYDALLRWAGRRKAAHLAPHLTGARVLDLGSGEGYVGQALAKRGHQVLGADVVPFQGARIPYTLYDGRNLPFPTDSFDHVILSLVLHHSREPRAVIREALRVASGSVVVTESTYRTRLGLRLLTFMDRWANRFRGDGALQRMEEHLHFRTVEEWEELFREEHASVVRIRWLNRVLHRYVLFEVLVPGEESPPATDASSFNAGASRRRALPKRSSD